MKAIVFKEYGPPDEIQLKEVEKRVPKGNEVLIKILAITETTTDCNIRNSTFVPTLFLLPRECNLVSTNQIYLYWELIWSEKLKLQG